MPYLVVGTEADAQAISREAWESVLGHPKNAKDVTEFLWAVDVGKDGRAAVVASDRQDLIPLSRGGMTTLEALPDDGGNWQKPITKSSIP